MSLGRLYLSDLINQGQWITIQNDQNGNTYQAYIADECPTCPGYGDLDLSPSVFGGLNDG